MQAKGPSLATIKSSPVFKCTCGGITFSEKLTFRKLSALISPTGNEEMMPVPVFVCDKCGLAPSEFDTYSLVPEELKNKQSKTNDVKLTIKK